MNNPGRSLPKEVVDHWPEVFEEIQINVLPLKYLHTVLVNFNDGRTWEIRVTAQVKKDGWDSFEKNLSDLCKHYEEQINDIDLKLDPKQIKRDIEKSTKKFLKKRKL